MNLTIADGEIFGIIGLSGAGKSTLVRCINLLERPTSGEVLVDGQNIMTLSQKELLQVRRQIGMIFQGFNLLEQRTVLRNICFPLEISGTPKAEAKKRAEELLRVVGLSDKEMCIRDRDRVEPLGEQRAVLRAAALDGGDVARVKGLADELRDRRADVYKRQL